jgi:hypothetical protein
MVRGITPVEYRTLQRARKRQITGNCTCLKIYLEAWGTNAESRNNLSGIPRFHSLYGLRYSTTITFALSMPVDPRIRRK